MFESIFWIIIIMIWISSIFSKAKKAGQSKQGAGLPEPPAKEDAELEKEIFRRFGLPQYQVPKPKAKVIKAPTPKKPTQVEFKDVPRYKQSPAPPAEQTVTEKTPAIGFSMDKLEEGIILAEILGPPKAYQFCRGVGTGIRSGLKNRWA